jgi:MerR family transcriptional regulator, heat shock protein HspR
VSVDPALRAWVLGFGPDALVRTPEHLASLVREAASATLAAYAYERRLLVEAFMGAADRRDVAPTVRPATLTHFVSSPILDTCQGAGVPDELIFISMAARMLGMHPQTLRKYERLGLVRPTRTIGSMRLYSREELERLRFIKYLVEDVGVNLAGVQQLLEIGQVMRRIQPLMHEDVLARSDTRRRLLREMSRLNAMLGIDA